MASAAITCAPPTNRPKSSVPFPVPNKTASQITRPAIHMGARRAHLPTPTRPKFFTHADATRTPSPRRQRHATPTPSQPRSHTHMEASNHEGFKGARTGAGKEKKRHQAKNSNPRSQQLLRVRAVRSGRASIRRPEHGSGSTTRPKSERNEY